MYTCELDAAQQAAMVAVLEPLRASLEAQILDFDEESQSWRDYRNVMVGNIDPEIMHQLDVIATC